MEGREEKDARRKKNMTSFKGGKKQITGWQIKTLAN